MTESDLRYLQSLFTDLHGILTQEMNTSEVNVRYITSEIEFGLQLIEDTLRESNLLDATEQELRRIYRDVSAPRVGINDLFVWRPDAKERIQANKAFGSLKNELRAVLG